ncbi:hypothetical protein [Rhodococcus oryzae]|uniref:hypothetical protein n=1 Tax=Rhodococcus oryzae TaxID=2571143 RepID=UPI003791F76D
MRCDDVGALLDRYGEAAWYFARWRERSISLGLPSIEVPSISATGEFVYTAQNLTMGVVIAGDLFSHLTVERGRRFVADQFSRFDDAAKLLLKSEGEQVRSYLKLPRKYFDWKAMGVHPAVSVDETGHSAVLTLRDDRSVWCRVPALDQAATSQIMMLSLAELDAQLTEGMRL